MSDGYYYEQDPKSHDWKRDEYGEVDRWALHFLTCNGPECARCGFSFCHHCMMGEWDKAPECPGESS